MEETFTAIVTKIDNDKKIPGGGFRGRIKVACADLLGDFTTEVPVWIEPRLDWGWFVVPDIGEMIFIELTTESNDDDVRYQVTIDAPDINWSGARYYSENETGDTPTEINEVFKTNYGKRRGFCTPYGHTILFDDTKGDSQVYISAVVKKHNPVSGEEVSSELTNQIILDKTGIHMSVLGDSSKHVAIVETLAALWKSQESWLAEITVPTGMGPSGVPINNPPPTWDDTIESTKVTIPDG